MTVMASDSMRVKRRSSHTVLFAFCRSVLWLLVAMIVFVNVRLYAPSPLARHDNQVPGDLLHVQIPRARRSCVTSVLLAARGGSLETKGQMPCRPSGSG